MLRALRTPLFVLGLTVFVGLATACGGGSAEDKIAAQRSRYNASLNGYIIQEEPMAAVVEMEEGAEMALAGEPPDEAAVDAAVEGAIEEVAEEALEEGLEPLMAPVPLKQSALLDILVQHDSREKLPGLTVDISMADAGQQEKGHWRVWVDTSTMERGPGAQITHVIEDVPYVEGDGFHVEVRHPVPVEERGEYREFSAQP